VNVPGYTVKVSITFNHPGTTENVRPAGDMRKKARVEVREAPAKNWLFTDFGCTEELDFDPLLVSYLVAQREICPKTGRMHWQGYMQLKVKSRLLTIKNKINSTAHFMKARGTAQENFDYCTKTDTRAFPDEGYVEWGEMVKCGQRTDLMEYVVAVEEGAREHDLIHTYTHVVCMYPRFYEKIRASMPEPEIQKKVVLLVGPTGKGKTYYVRNMYKGNRDFFVKAIGDPKWWTRYDRHKYVLWDEFCGRASRVPLDQLLAITSEWPQYLETKGGETLFCPELLYITSNFTPNDWYDFTGRETQYEAMLRRFTQIRYWEADTPREAPILLDTLADMLERFPLRPVLAGRDYNNGQRASLY